MPIRSNASIRPASDEREVRGFIGPDSERTSYLTAGIVTGEPILLIHGTGMSARSWTNQLRGLAPALAVVAIDLPGHGESDPASEATVESYADAAGRLLDALGTGPVVVAGHSLGGAVALALAARHPKLVKALVLISSCAKLPENNGSLERLFGSLPAPIRRFFFFSTSRKALFSLGAPMRAVQLGLKDLRSCRPETVRKDVAAAKAIDLEGVAQGLRVPALILCGARDMLTPVALSEQLRDLIPDSRLHLVEKVGHMLPLEAPERVNQEILDFVESVVGRRMRHPLLAGHATKRAMFRRFIDKAWALCRGKSRPSESLPVPGDRPELRTGRRRRLTGSRVAHWRPAHHVREVSGLRDHPPERE